LKKERGCHEPHTPLFSENLHQSWGGDGAPAARGGRHSGARTMGPTKFGENVGAKAEKRAEKLSQEACWEPENWRGKGNVTGL